jgi:hypothetical protein
VTDADDWSTSVLELRATHADSARGFVVCSQQAAVAGYYRLPIMRDWSAARLVAWSREADSRERHELAVPQNNAGPLAFRGHWTERTFLAALAKQ